MCLELCDGLAKATYSRLFDWLQAQLTAALAAHNASAASAAHTPNEQSLTQVAPLCIGLLDIFGFEVWTSSRAYARALSRPAHVHTHRHAAGQVAAQSPHDWSWPTTVTSTRPAAVNSTTVNSIRVDCSGL